MLRKQAFAKFYHTYVCRVYCAFINNIYLSSDWFKSKQLTTEDSANDTSNKMEMVELAETGSLLTKTSYKFQACLNIKLLYKDIVRA